MLKPNNRLNKIRGWTFAVFSPGHVSMLFCKPDDSADGRLLFIIPHDSFIVICASSLTVSPWALNVVDEQLHALCYTIIPVISQVAIVLEFLRNIRGKKKYM